MNIDDVIQVLKIKDDYILMLERNIKREIRNIETYKTILAIKLQKELEGHPEYTIDIAKTTAEEIIMETDKAFEQYKI